MCAPSASIQEVAAAALIGVSLFLPSPAEGQGVAGATSRLPVFAECEGGACDAGELADRIGWVDWVGAAGEAAVVTSVSASPAGVDPEGLIIRFDGDEGLELQDDELFLEVGFGDPPAQTLDRLATLVSIGLARYSTIAGYRDFVTLRPAGEIDPNERIVSPQEVDDPWNLWTFRINGSTNVSGEETSETRRFNGGFSANRTTPTWKISFNGRGNINIREIERSNGTIFKSDQRDWNFNANITYTLADHWSLHGSSSSGKYPTANQDFRQEVLGGIEYSLFPYEEATRRAIIARYTIGPTYRNYEDRSIFGKLEETPWEQAVNLRAAMRQPWGDASATVTASHILDDIDKHNLSLRGDLSFRIVRGLSFNTGGDISWVTDQVYLSAGGQTDEQILLRLRTRASSFNYGLNAGFSYQFGSIFNNTVNNRFRGAPGGGTGGGGGGRGGGGVQ